VTVDCAFCGKPVDPRLRETWHRIVAWERKGRAGGSDVACRERHGDEYAHPACVALAQNGHAGQTTLDPPELGDPELEAEPLKQEGSEWPLPVFLAAKAMFGDKIHNRQSSTRKGLDRKIVYALQVWDEKYGPLNPAQADYAAELLASRFNTEPEVDLDLPLVYVRLDEIVHHDVVHRGFLKRAG
jgi:hypothetical protein